MGDSGQLHVQWVSVFPLHKQPYFLRSYEGSSMMAFLLPIGVWHVLTPTNERSHPSSFVSSVLFPVLLCVFSIYIYFL